MGADTSSERQFLIHPEYHEDSDRIISFPGETNEINQDGENNIKVKGTGVVVYYYA